jgi:hypothetical protein
MAKDSFCWLQYTFAVGNKQIKSEEIKFNDKHVHGAQPTEADWQRCEASLYAAVEKVAAEIQKKAQYPGDNKVLGAAKKKKNSEYCWLEYMFAGANRVIKSGEHKYADGHGAQPTDEDWTQCGESLKEAVRTVAAEIQRNAQYPGDATVLGHADKKTRTAK